MEENCFVCKIGKEKYIHMLLQKILSICDFLFYIVEISLGFLLCKYGKKKKEKSTIINSAANNRK